MKKKTLLATLVMLSILNGNVFAESVKPDNYDDFFEKNVTGENQVQISKNGNYTFKNGASIINTDLEKDDGAQAIIHHSGTNKDNINKITINVGNNEKRSKFILKGVSSKNILNAIDAAKKKNMQVIFLTSEMLGAIYLQKADIAICVPSDDTALIQEAHEMIEHLICLEVEKERANHA